MLRAHFLAEVSDTLAFIKMFVSEDFDIGQQHANGRSQLTVRYRYDGQYFFFAQVPQNPSDATVGETVKRNTYEIPVRMAPGTMSREETTTVYGSSELLSSMKSWLQNLQTELRALPEVRAQESLRREVHEFLQSMAAQITDISEDYFSTEEAETLKQRLGELEKRMEEAAAKAVQDQATLDAKLRAIHREFEGLRAQTAILNKSNWFKAMLVRVGRWMSDPENRQLLQSGAEVTKLLLGAGKTPSDR
jgi:hypothetical protein